MKNIRMILVIILSFFSCTIFGFDMGKISSGTFHSCALDDDGVKCWGSKSFGKVSVPQLKNPKSVTAGLLHTCALDDDGVKCWGDNRYGQLNVPLIKNPRLVSVGAYFTCALDNDGVKCWGANDPKFGFPDIPFCYSDGIEIQCRDRKKQYGQINIPQLKNPKQVSAGSYHFCALHDDGVKCWGDNQFGQTDVPQLKNPKLVSAGVFHTCALDDYGVKCWGYDQDGQTNVPQLKNPTLVSANGSLTCALDDDGVKCWGDNKEGQINIPHLKNPTLVSVGESHICALDDDGVKCWGDNKEGQTTVPKLKFGPNFGDPRFNSTQIAEYLETLTLGSTPVRTSLFKRLSVFAKDSLKENPILLPINQFALAYSRALFIGLIAPAITSGDSQYYQEKIIPEFKKSAAKMNEALGISDLSEIPADIKLVRKTAVIIIQATLQSANDFFTLEERTQLQEINRLLGQAFADSSRLNVLNALAAVEAKKPLLHKLENSPKTSFLLTTLMTTTEWLSSKI